MTVRLNDYWPAHLARMPQTGMGYQRVDLVFKDGRALENLVVINAEDCQSEETFNVEDITEIRIHKHKPGD